MALIPNDVGIRMRMQTEAQLLQPVHPVADIPSDLPALRLGQTFSAKIQEVLPENTYKALVAGKSLTLSLPESAKAGDSLELIVVDRSSKTIVAQLASPTTTAGKSEPYQYSTLSRAAQLIGTLLPAEGEAAAPVTLNRGQPLLSEAPLLGKQLAPALADAVKHSGLFYEAHQAQWVSGRLPLQQLLQDPQAQHSNMAVLLAASIPLQEGTGTGDSAQKSALAGRQAEPASLLQTLLGRSSAAAPASALPMTPGATTSAATGATLSGSQAAIAGSTSAAGQVSQTNQNSQTIPDDLRPIVQQQLDAVATQRLAWHGEVWPNQQIKWEIDWESDNDPQQSDQEQVWSTTLSLTTPRLGDVHARLQLTEAGVRIAIATPYGASAADLREAAPALELSLEAAGVPLLGLLVKHDAE